MTEGERDVGARLTRTEGWFPGRPVPSSLHAENWLPDPRPGRTERAAPPSPGAGLFTKAGPTKGARASLEPEPAREGRLVLHHVQALLPQLTWFHYCSHLSSWLANMCDRPVPCTAYRQVCPIGS